MHSSIPSCRCGPRGLSPGFGGGISAIRVQEDGAVWMSGTTWDGRKAVRLSVSNWQTGPAEIDLALERFATAAAQEPAHAPAR